MCYVLVMRNRELHGVACYVNVLTTISMEEMTDSGLPNLDKVWIAITNENQ